MSAVLRVALAQRYPEREAQAAAADKAARIAAPKFQNVYCSQCAGEFGSGDNGFSHCDQHAGPIEPEDNSTSFQRLGSTRVLVCYTPAEHSVSIDGALINGEFVEADWFDAGTVRKWQQAIDIEIAGDNELAKAEAA